MLQDRLAGPIVVVFCFNVLEVLIHPPVQLINVI